MIGEVLTATTVVVAVGAALATLALVGFVAILRARRRRRDQQDVVALVSQMNTRIESIVQEVVSPALLLHPFEGAGQTTS